MRYIFACCILLKIPHIFDKKTRVLARGPRRLVGSCDLRNARQDFCSAGASVGNLENVGLEKEQHVILKAWLITRKLACTSLPHGDKGH